MPLQNTSCKDSRRAIANCFNRCHYGLLPGCFDWSQFCTELPEACWEVEVVAKQMIRRVQGPDMEMGFYCHDRTETEALNALVTALLDIGASPAGVAYACDRNVYENIAFRGYLDLPLTALSIIDSADLRRHLNLEQQQLLYIEMLGASGCAFYDAEQVTFARISHLANRVDKHPVMINASGDKINMFFEPGTTRSERTRAESLGKKVFKRFTEIVERVLPAYAAITIEEDLFCPVDLELDPNPILFKEFYVSESFVGPTALDAITRIYGDTPALAMGDGLYFSTTGFFSPRRCTSRDADESNYSKSEAVSRIIAHAGANWRRSNPGYSR